MHVHDVIIVGAGMAGLAASKFLHDSGFHDFLILEAQDKIGGRILTKEFGGRAEPGLVELGAQWIHGEDNDFFKLVQAGGLIHEKTSWEGTGEFRTADGELLDSAKVQNIIDWVNEQLDSLEGELSSEPEDKNGTNEDKSDPQNGSESVGAYLKRNFKTYMKENHDLPPDLQEAVFHWANSYHRIDNCCNQMADLSKIRWADFQVNQGELYNNFKGGADSVISELMKNVLTSSNLRLRKPVVKINWQSEEIQVFVDSEKDEFYLCHAVIVTCSVGVLQNSLKMFSPRLPQDVSAAIMNTGFGPLTKIFLEWDIPWWPPGDFKGYQLIWPGQFINCCDDTYEVGVGEMSEKIRQSWFKSITGFDPVLENPNVLLGWLGGPEAIYVESLDPEVVGDKCVEVLRQFTGIKVPSPKSVLISRWSSNPYVRGAYCYRSIQGDKFSNDIPGILTKPICNQDDFGIQKPAIVFAGEALHKSHYSTLHGAFDSGKQQAKNLLALLQSWQQLRTDCESLCGANVAY